MPLHHSGDMALTHFDHAHRWTTQSRHFTSTGAVVYQRCSCGAFSVIEYPIGSTDTPDEAVRFCAEVDVISPRRPTRCQKASPSEFSVR